jgi:serum/glucocorticoid-regulated kinase 2
LARKASSRLGVNGNEEVKNHPWFADFNWDDLENMKLEAPYKPDNT